MNKYLRKMIEEYLDFKPKFKDELLNKTKNLLIDHYSNWYYYNTYIVCDNNYMHNNTKYNRGYKYTTTISYRVMIAKNYVYYY
jgi:hypothetical protein